MVAIRFKKSVPLVLAAAALIGAAPSPPAVLAPYIHDGRFDPGDYHWLRGEFDGATKAEIADYQSVLVWRQRCRTDDMAETRGDLAKLGVSAGATLNTIPYKSLLCMQVASLPEPLDLHDWDGFERDVAAVRPMVQGFLAAVSMGEDAAAVDSPVARDALNARAIGEQALRSGLLWITGSSTDGLPALKLTSKQRGIAVAQLGIALAERDHGNTIWLKELVEKDGWPKRSQVGESAAKAAWLLVQHADADPAFQVRVLRLIEPLVSSGEADRKNFAYLYDRVMLKIVGRQRFATQLSCRNGRLAPELLEDERKVDIYRKAAGMSSLAEYEAQVAEAMGPCAASPQ